MAQTRSCRTADFLGWLGEKMMPIKKTMVVVGHGSRSKSANRDFERFVEAFRGFFPGQHIKHAYVELARPVLNEVLGEVGPVSDEVVIMPLFLFGAGHVKNDIPLMVNGARNNFPGTKFYVALPVGVHPNMVSLISKRVAGALGERDKSRTAVLIVGRGSSDPDANSDFCKLVRLFEETSGYGRVVYSFVGIAKPNVEEALERLVREEVKTIVIQPYLLFSGLLIQKLEEMVGRYTKLYPWVQMKISNTLGEDELIFNLMQERMDGARTQNKPLPCDNCQYRVPINGLDKVGGLKALLWSLRHTLTHNQAMPHTHAHTPVSKHVLVCGNVNCVDQGSIQLIESLRRLIKEKGLEKSIMVTKTSCLSHCGEGPTVIVYPDGIWYRRCEEKYVAELYEKHLMNNQLVSEIVDQIMQ